MTVAKFLKGQLSCNLYLSLRNSIDDITAILNAKLKNSDISTKHKESIETQIEVLTNLIKSIPLRLTILSTKDGSIRSNYGMTKKEMSLIFNQNNEIKRPISQICRWFYSF